MFKKCFISCKNSVPATIKNFKVIFRNCNFYHNIKNYINNDNIIFSRNKLYLICFWIGYTSCETVHLFSNEYRLQSSFFISGRKRQPASRCLPCLTRIKATNVFLDFSDFTDDEGDDIDDTIYTKESENKSCGVQILQYSDHQIC
jgi:hypothetical protein